MKWNGKNEVISPSFITKRNFANKGRLVIVYASLVFTLILCLFGRANRKFACVRAAYFKDGGGICVTLFKGLPTCAPHLTTTNPGHTGFFGTNHGLVTTLFKDTNCTGTLFKK